MVLGLVAGAGADPEPLLLDGETVTPGTEARYVVGWVDDGGGSHAWPLESAAPAASTAGIAVAPLGGTSSLVALTGSAGVGGSTSRALVLPVDLCRRAEQPPILDCAQGVSGVAIDADEDGRMAIALSVTSGAACSVLPGDRMLPAGIGAEDTVLLHVAPDGGCASTLIREDDEGTASPYSVQNGASVALAEDGAVVVVGVYDGDLFGGAAAIATGVPHYLEGKPPYSFERFHRYLARFEVDGAALRVDDAVDLGIIAFAVGGHDVAWRDGAAVVVGGAYIASQPTGPFDRPVSLTGAGYLDVLAGVFPTPAAPTGLGWYGGNSVDVPWRLSSTDAGMMTAGWSTSIEETFAPCADPIVIGDNGAPVGGGRAFFAPLDDDGAFGEPFVVDAAGPGALDVGHGAFALPGGDSIIVGVTGGEVQLDRALPAPPKNFVDVYVARRP